MPSYFDKRLAEIRAEVQRVQVTPPKTRVRPSEKKPDASAVPMTHAVRMVDMLFRGVESATDAIKRGDPQAATEAFQRMRTYLDHSLGALSAQ